jgi:[ribosomal protein S18]-alanine N-acetyltransferase
MTVLRPMRWWDIDAALAIERALFPDAWSDETFWVELARVPETRHYLVADDDGAVVGYAGLMTVGRQADVQTVAVAPGHQGQHLGATLLRAIVDEATSRGCTEVLLEVRVDNEPAVHLYQKAGFERISVRRGYYPGGIDGLVMRLRI